MNQDIKRNNHTILSTKAEKTFDNILHSFTIKTVNQLTIKGNLLNLTEDTYKTYEAKIEKNHKEKDNSHS